MQVDGAVLADLVEFARIEVDAHDLEPWAEMIGALRASGQLDVEQAHWVTKLYNAYDSLGSAWGVYRRWGSPMVWAVDPEAPSAADFPCTQERRGLRGGRVLHHLDSYVGFLAGGPQDVWLRSALARVGDDPQAGFRAMLAHVRQVWGVGRQTAFEWAEFLAKANGYPIDAPDAELWESEGPRRSLQRLYGNETPDLAWLNEAANVCRDHLASEGVPLAWVDFETVICDFNVMRHGRYYPGRHLAALREEIAELDDEADRAMMLDAFRSIAPGEWADIAPGIDMELMPVYKLTGKLAPAVR